MDLTILKSIKLSLEIELSNNLKSTDKLQPIYQHKLALLIDGLRELIDLQENPDKHAKLNKLCNPEK